jgi:hypothetical protein
VGKHVRRLLNYVAISLGIGLFLALAREIEPLQRLDGLTREYQDVLMRIAIGTAALGWLIFMVSIIYMVVIPDLRKRRAPRRIQSGFTFSAIKRALRRGSFWREEEYRFLFFIASGALTMCIGLFSIAFVMGEPGVKLIVGIAVVYAIVRLVWGFAQA